MSGDIKTRWLGYLRGARTGTLFFEDIDGENGTLSIGFNGSGDLRLRVKAASSDQNTLELTTEGSNEPFGSASIEYQTETEVKGSWSFLSGASGIFELGLHQPASDSASPPSPPSQIINREVPLGAITLYRNDLVRLIAEMESLVPSPSITTIRATENDQIIIEPAEKYLARRDYIDVVRVITISTSENNSLPLKKIANVILNDDGSSQIMITSPDELWTSAAALRLEKYLGQFSSRLTGWLRRKGLNINSFILIAILIWMPDRPLLERIVVFAAGVIIIAVIARSHRLLPFNRVYLDPDRQKRPFSKELPGVTLGLVAAGITGLLSSISQITKSLVQFVQFVGNQLGF